MSCLVRTCFIKKKKVRSREFEQCEIEYFIQPGGEETWKPVFDQWYIDARSFLLSIGVSDELMGTDVHKKER